MPVTEDARTVRSLPEAWRVFVAHASPRLLALQFVIALGLRLRLLAHGGSTASAWELVMPLVAFGLVWPLQEWWAHKHLLHLRPRDLAGLRIDPLFARKHREHHRTPWYLPDIFLPPRLLVALIPIHCALWWWLTPTPELALTGILSYGGAALHYEWIHYLTHTSYKPRSAWFKRVRRNHRYHHFKNEAYWHGFSLPIVDTLFGTAPDPSTVETSKTARELLS